MINNILLLNGFVSKYYDYLSMVLIDIEIHILNFKNNMQLIVKLYLLLLKNFGFITDPKFYQSSMPHYNLQYRPQRLLFTG